MTNLDHGQLLSLLKTPSLRASSSRSSNLSWEPAPPYVALMLVAYHRLHSGWAIALVLLADFLPGIALGAPFGTLADRLPRRRLMISVDVLRSYAFLGLAVIPSFGATVALALIAGVGTSMYRTSRTTPAPVAI
jgi:MFS family permease